VAAVEGLAAAHHGLLGVGVPVHQVQARKQGPPEVGVVLEDPGVGHGHHHALPSAPGPGLGEAGEGQAPLPGEEGLPLALGPKGPVGEEAPAWGPVPPPAPGLRGKPLGYPHVDRLLQGHPLRPGLRHHQAEEDLPPEALPLGHHPGAVGPGLLGQEGQGEGPPALLQGHGRWGEALGEGLHLHGEVHPGAGLGGELGRGQAEPQHPGPLQAAPRQGQGQAKE